jgi:hypothetical protein
MIKINLQNIRNQIIKTSKDENKDSKTFTLTVNRETFDEIMKWGNSIEQVTDIKVKATLVNNEFYLNPNRIK